MAGLRSWFKLRTEQLLPRSVYCRCDRDFLRDTETFLPLSFISTIVASLTHVLELPSHKKHTSVKAEHSFFFFFYLYFKFLFGYLRKVMP